MIDIAKSCLGYHNVVSRIVVVRGDVISRFALAAQPLPLANAICYTSPPAVRFFAVLTRRTLSATFAKQKAIS